MILCGRANYLLGKHLGFIHLLTQSFIQQTFIEGLKCTGNKWRHIARARQTQFLSLNIPWLIDILISCWTIVALKCHHFFLWNKCLGFSHPNPLSKCHRTNAIIKKHMIEDLCAQTGSQLCNPKPNNRRHYWFVDVQLRELKWQVAKT